MKTPLITPTTAKPMVSLWINAGIKYASYANTLQLLENLRAASEHTVHGVDTDTFSTKRRQTGGQFASATPTPAQVSFRS
eukprot:835444-Amphidinium_carterae.1